jgi:hypothetical protein
VTTYPQNGQVFILTSANGMVADVNTSDPSRGNRIQAWTPNGSTAQTWVFWAKENGTWLLETGLTNGRHAPGQAMVMDYDYTNFNTHVFDEHGQPNQLWCVEDTGDGWVRFKSARQDEGDAYLTADRQGEALGVWRLDPDGSGQRWQLTPAGAAGGSSGGGQAQQAQPPRTPLPNQQPAQGGDIQGALLNLLNGYRQRNGLSPVNLDSRLSAVATASSQEQARRHQQGHYVDLMGGAGQNGYRAGGVGEVAGGAHGFWATPPAR